ncbi:hypothetical protein B7R21_16000 [Subtercola boreus]|uniref:Uncharacterized protein n=1 Tax=Subtercola boreus TaxID=120213 RepID=A0A3E0VE75_9MICO|nr:hypothetical protein B7R21_16000 [Subtercola boreus]
MTKSQELIVIWCLFICLGAVIAVLALLLIMRSRATGNPDSFEHAGRDPDGPIRIEAQIAVARIARGSGGQL